MNDTMKEWFRMNKPKGWLFGVLKELKEARQLLLEAIPAHFSDENIYYYLDSLARRFFEQLLPPPFCPCLYVANSFPEKRCCDCCEATDSFVGFRIRITALIDAGYRGTAFHQLKKYFTAVPLVDEGFCIGDDCCCDIDDDDDDCYCDIDDDDDDFDDDDDDFDDFGDDDDE